VNSGRGEYALRIASDRDETHARVGPGRDERVLEYGGNVLDTLDVLQCKLGCYIAANGRNIGKTKHAQDEIETRHQTQAKRI